MKILRILLILSFALICLAPMPARAADGVVQPPCDEAAFNAVLDAVQASGGGTVTFNCGTKIILFDNEKTIYSDVTIDGGGKITLSGQNQYRLFYINGGYSFSLKNITISNGYTIGSPGGAVYNDFGTLNINNSTFTRNQAPQNEGGAIASTGVVNILDSEFTENQALSGGAIYLQYGSAETTITNSQFSSNQASSELLGGGAILVNEGAKATITGGSFQDNQNGGSGSNGGALYIGLNSSADLENVLVSRNNALRNGGGIYNRGTTSLTNVTLKDNNAEFQGGGGIYNDGTATLTNVTISNNSASYGGGIYNYGTATLTNVTISGNISVGGGGGIFNDGTGGLTNVTLYGNRAGQGGGIFASVGTITLKNTVVANSTGGNCKKVDKPTAFLVSYGYNLSDGSTCTPYFDQPGDQNAVAAQLGPLADNGGPTLTHLPGADSPLVDGGSCSVFIQIDQRGVYRPQGAACDIGAVERQPDDGWTFLYLPVITR